MKQSQSCVLLAHRGYSKQYPENTLLALKKALELGACCVEIDVHLSADAIPVVIHDRSVLRTSAEDGQVHLMPYAKLEQLSVHYAQKFGDSYQPEPVPSLAQVVELMRQWPDRTLFVEIKRAGIEYFGVDIVMEKIAEVLIPVMQQCVIISFDRSVPQKARDLGFTRVGWVFEDWGEDSKRFASQLQADYLFTDYTVVPDHATPLWAGPWQWVLYAVDDPDLAVYWLSKGAAMIETNDIETLLKHPKLISWNR